MQILFMHWSEILMLFANISNVKLMLVYFTAQMHQFQGNIFNFSLKFCKILPQNMLFDFDFWKVQIKIVKAVICGNKIKCARALGNKLVFYFGLIMFDLHNPIYPSFLFVFDSGHSEHLIQSIGPIQTKAICGTQGLTTVSQLP